jgi:hypothetical protein
MRRPDGAGLAGEVEGEQLATDGLAGGGVGCLPQRGEQAGADGGIRPEAVQPFEVERGGEGLAALLGVGGLVVVEGDHLVAAGDAPRLGGEVQRLNENEISFGTDEEIGGGMAGLLLGQGQRRVVVWNGMAGDAVPGEAFAGLVSADDALPVGAPGHASDREPVALEREDLLPLPRVPDLQRVV